MLTHKVILCAILLSVISRSNQQEPTKPEVIGTCGGRYIGARTGSFASPGFPNLNYNSTASCTYEIEAPPGYIIAYESTYMNIEPELFGLCLDFVAVYKTGNVNAEPEWFCGSTRIPQDSTTGNRLVVRFESDSTFNYPGFVITWAIVDPTALPPVLECNFDGAISLCSGWTQFQYDSFDWFIERARNSETVTSIGEDHTTGTTIGRYAYIKTSEGYGPGANAFLLSPIAHVDDDDYCFNLWYRSSGDGYLYILKVNSDGSADYIFSTSSATDGVWQAARAYIPRSQTPIQIAIEGVTGVNSTLAIDDLIINKGPCVAPSTSTVTPRITARVTTEPATTPETLTTDVPTTDSTAETTVSSTTLDPAVSNILNTLHNMFTILIEWVRNKEH